MERCFGVWLSVAAVLFSTTSAQAASTGFNQTGAGPYDYNTGVNWVSSTISGTWDTSLTLAAGQTVTFAADTTLSTALNFNYAGNYALTLKASAAGTKTITLGGDIGLNTGGGTTANVTIGDSANHLNVNLGGVTRTMTVASSRTLTIADVISNGGITKAGSGTLPLSGANTFSGELTMNGGVVNVSALNNYSANGPLGNRTSAADTTTTIGLHFTGGTLQYTGSTAQSTDRQVRIKNGVASFIDASGTGNGTISFTCSSANVNFWDTSGSRTLTLTGTQTGNNVFAINIKSHTSGQTTLVKNGIGTWDITNTHNSDATNGNNNTFGGYGGGTTISGGVLGFVNNAIGGGVIDFTGNATLRWDSGNTQDISSGTGGDVARSIKIEDGVTATLDINGNNVTLANAFTVGTLGTGALTVNSTAGGGTLTLFGVNTYTGATSLNAGTLLVNGSLASGSAVAVNGGGTLGGTGVVNGTVAVSGTLDPGASVGATGTLTNKGDVGFASGATFNVDISGDGTTTDVIDLGGTAKLTITSGAILKLGTLVSGHTCVIARHINSTITGTFTLSPSLPSGWYIHYVNNSPNSYIVINQSATPVVLLQLQALTLGGKVTVRWSTSSESKTAGFDLYRVVNGQPEKLNDTLIAAKGWPNGGVGASYSVADSTAQPGQNYTYKVVERTTDGQSIDYGPYDRTVSEFVMKPLEVTAAGAKVRWLSRAGEIYRVLKSTDLTSGQYQPIAENVTATPPENEYLDAAPGNSGFYRIELQP